MFAVLWECWWQPIPCMSPETVVGCQKGPDPTSLQVGYPGCHTVLASGHECSGIHVNLDVGNPVQTHPTLTDKYLLLRCLLEDKMQGALVRSHFTQLHEIGASTRFFFGVGEKVYGQSTDFFFLWLLDGCLTADPAEIWKAAVSFYSTLYLPEACDVLAMEELHQEVSYLTAEEQQYQDTSLSLQELCVAVQAALYRQGASGAGMYPGGKDAPQLLQSVVTLLHKNGDLYALWN
ncbi:unnamed protein product [Caretta caretta]